MEHTTEVGIVDAQILSIAISLSGSYVLGQLPSGAEFLECGDLEMESKLMQRETTKMFA